MLFRTEDDEIVRDKKVGKIEFGSEEDREGDENVGDVWHLVAHRYRVGFEDAECGESVAEKERACCEEGEGEAGPEVEVAAHDGRTVVARRCWWQLRRRWCQGQVVERSMTIIEKVNM